MHSILFGPSILPLSLLLTHSLKDAVKEKVKEIESESRTRIKQFIRNKEVWSTITPVYSVRSVIMIPIINFQAALVTANVTLPTFLLPSSKK